MKWFAKHDFDDERSIDRDELHSWTITTNEAFCGWDTDSGTGGYGIPRELAEWVCDKLNTQHEKPPYFVDKFGFWKKNDKS